MNPYNRSSLYHAWLMQQPAEYRARLWAAEAKFVADQRDRAAHIEQMFRDSLEGYAETPAGTRDLNPNFDSPGNWSWKPGRDKALGDNMVTFKGVPPSAAEACVREGIHKGFGWRG